MRITLHLMMPNNLQNGIHTTKMQLVRSLILNGCLVLTMDSILLLVIRHTYNFKTMVEN